MNTTEARQLAGEWHGGQTSALYSFSSTGVIHFDYWDYSREIKQCLRELGYDQRAEEGQLLALLLWFNEHCPRDEDEEEEDEEEDEEDEPTLHECNCGFSTENEYDWDEHECNFTRGRPV